MVKTESRDESDSLTVEAQAAITISIKPKERKGDFAVMMLGAARPIDIITAMAAGTASMIRMIGKEKYTLCEETKRIFMEELDKKMRLGAFENEICKITPAGREDKVRWNDEPKTETAV